MRLQLHTEQTPAVTLAEDRTEATSMSRSRNEDRSRGRRRHRRNSSGRLEPDDGHFDEQAILDEIDQPTEPASFQAPRPPAAEMPPIPSRPSAAAYESDPALDVEGEDYARARALGERKAELFIDGGKKAIAVLILLVIPPMAWLGVILAIVWGIRFARKYFRLMVEPGLRERLVEGEVERQVHANVSQERRSLEGQHSRSLEQLSASIAHEIRNPITAAKSLVQQMSEDPDSADNPEYARVAVGELARVERSITHLLRFARDEEMRLDIVSMVDVCESALETFRDRASREQVEIVKQFDCDGRLEGDADQLRRIVINLVGNGIDAMVEAGVESPRIEISLGENLAGTEVWLRVRDNGNGIDERVRGKIFSPFVTSKTGGTGLGLPITKKLVEGHAGTIELSTEPGRGAEFVITLPKRSGGTGGL